jgi:hypothetical protein
MERLWCSKGTDVVGSCSCPAFHEGTGISARFPVPQSPRRILAPPCLSGEGSIGTAVAVWNPRTPHIPEASTYDS